MRTNKIIIVVVLALFSIHIYAQDKYKLQEGEVSFYSSAPLEDIKALNKKPVGIIDFKAQKFSFRINIKDFIFNSSLMQEHFNENYMESDIYPSSTYKGDMTGEFDITKDGEYNLLSKGELTIHGITKNVEIPAVIIVKGSEIFLKSDFKVKLKDYKIEIPTIVFEKIAEVVEVKIYSSLILLEKK
ncbi:MAG: YceI family protein [Bacteroidota bacterium]|nr:YceI family protein [Bacteroidota bacterium]